MHVSTLQKIPSAQPILQKKARRKISSYSDMRSSITSGNTDGSVDDPLTAYMLYERKRKQSPTYNSTHPQLFEVEGHGGPLRDQKLSISFW
jgi:hypothetical protein